HVIRFVYDKRPDLAVAQPAPVTTDLAVAQPQAAQQSEVVPLAASAPAPTHVDESVKERILNLMVDKTGYPKDMLDLDLDLEADLGVDTVKQAEMFAAIREIYNIPRDENRKLRDYPTLAHVIRFVYEKRPDLASVAAPAAAPNVKEEVKVATSASDAVPEKSDSDDPVKERLLALAVEKT